MIKKRLMFFFVNIILCSVILINYINKKLAPIFIEYGEYQCTNILAKIINISIEENVDQNLKERAVFQNENNNNIDFNVDILNSLMCNILNRSRQILRLLESGKLDEKTIKKIGVDIDKSDLEKGIIYKIPSGMILDNVLLANMGVDIPVKYRIIGEIQGQIISSVKEYGINNALLELNLKITAQTKVAIPMVSESEKIEISVPLFVTVLQGDIPDYYLGSSVIGGVK